MTDTNEHAMQLRALVSSVDSGRNWDLRCHVREGLLAFVQNQYPEALPRWRGELSRASSEPSSPVDVPTAQPQRSPHPEDGGMHESEPPADAG